MFLLLVRGLVFEPTFVLRMVPRILRRHGWGRPGWDTIYKTLPFAGMKPAVVHFEFVYEATLYDGVLDSFDVPHLVSCRGDEDLVAPFIVERAVEEVAAALKRATEIHAVSRHTLEVARKAGAPGDKGVVINPAIPIDHFPARQRNDNSGPTRLVAVGRLTWTKGHEHLLRAIRLLLDRGMEVSCRIVGDG
jgi:colanic acid/amylovoran biosynthesis glycosyltransferase